MAQDTSGLQFILPGSSEWIDAPVRPGEFVIIVGDMLERYTNGLLRATPHRVVLTPHARSSIIRFVAVHGDTVVQPLPQLVSDAAPAKYSWVTMKTHMETTLRNLQKGLGAWDPVLRRSTTASYKYENGKPANEA